MKTLFFVLELGASQVHAANWIKVAGKWDFNGDQNLIFELDTDSIRSRAGLIQAWTRRSTPKPEFVTGLYPARRYQSSVSMYYFDCKHSELALARQMFYSKPFGEGDYLAVAGARISASSYAMKTPAQGTHGQSVLESVCRYKKML